MITPMNRTGRAVLVDWIVLTFRWVFILGTSLWLAFGEQIDLPVLAWLVILTLSNILATLLIVTDRATTRTRFICTLMDFIIAHSLFY